MNSVTPEGRGPCFKVKPCIRQLLFATVTQKLKITFSYVLANIAISYHSIVSHNMTGKQWVYARILDTFLNQTSKWNKLSKNVSSPPWAVTPTDVKGKWSIKFIDKYWIWNACCTCDTLESVQPTHTEGTTTYFIHTRGSSLTTKS